MELSKENSQIIEALRFPLILAMVMIHSYSTTVGMAQGKLVVDSGALNSYVQILFSQVLARMTVPMLFLLSGLLLFQDRKLNWSLVKSKWSSRLWRLLVPFLIWNAIVLSIQVSGQLLPFTRRFFTGATFEVDNASFYTISDALLGFDSGPVNWPLWFLRDLCLLVLASPLLYFIVKQTKGLILVVLCFVWFRFFIGYDPFPFLSTDTGGVFFFSFGMFLGYTDSHAIEEEVKKKRISVLLVGIYFITALFEAYAKQKNWPTFVLYRINIIIGVIAAYGLTYWIIGNEKVRKALLLLAPVSYLIYLAHGSLLMAFKKLGYVIIGPERDISLLSIYFGAPLITTGVLVLLYFLLDSKCRAILGVLTGRRNW
jgi:surface polysaccharide O-acyltransferase-like enzyme